jgi:hypothetical protein
VGAGASAVQGYVDLGRGEGGVERRERMMRREDCGGSEEEKGKKEGGDGRARVEGRRGVRKRGREGGREGGMREQTWERLSRLR